MCHTLTLSLWLCVYVSVSLFLCLSLCVCFCLSLSLWVCLCVCVSLCVYLCFFLPKSNIPLRCLAVSVHQAALPPLHPPPTPTYSWRAYLTLCVYICSASLGGKRFLRSCPVVTAVQSVPTETVDWCIPRQKPSMPNLPAQPIEDSPVGNAWQSVYWEFYVSSGQLQR